jgi:hypothetical protein|eukprot:3948671-Prymnesium_polylepis.2
MISGAYNFAQASKAFADLPKALNGAAACSQNRTSSVSTSKVNNRTSPASATKIKTVSDLLFKRSTSNAPVSFKSERFTSGGFGALDALKARLPSGTDVTAVGKTIHQRCVPICVLDEMPCCIGPNSVLLCCDSATAWRLLSPFRGRPNVRATLESARPRDDGAICVADVDLARRA